MKKLLKISAVSIFAVFSAFAVVSLTPSIASAQDAEQTPAPAENEQASQENNEAQGPYNYTAQPGDSYTKIARKAVQTHGINNNVNLSQAQIVAAETFLTNEAGSPNVNAGDKVNISEDAVKAAVERAEKLDDNAKALWERYVKFVDFNTDNVGESR